MKIKIQYGLNGTRVYEDMYLAYLRFIDLYNDGQRVASEVTEGSAIERKAWKEMFFGELDNGQINT